MQVDFLSQAFMWGAMAAYIEEEEKIMTQAWLSKLYTEKQNSKLATGS